MSEELLHSQQADNRRSVYLSFSHFRLEIRWIHLIRWEKIELKMKKKIQTLWDFEPLPTSNLRLAVSSANYYTTETTVSGET